MSASVVSLNSSAPLTALDQTDIEDTVPGGIAVDRLRSGLERWERLQDEVKALRSDQADILTEMDSAGFPKKVVRQLLKDRAAQEKNPDEAQEQLTMIDLCRRALGISR